MNCGQSFRESGFFLKGAGQPVSLSVCLCVCVWRSKSLRFFGEWQEANKCAGRVFSHLFSPLSSKPAALWTRCRVAYKPQVAYKPTALWGFIALTSTSVGCLKLFYFFVKSKKQKKKERSKIVWDAALLFLFCYRISWFLFIENTVTRRRKS